MTNERFPVNVLILGKTGVGKSSLLNYLFGDIQAQTGAGRPVTGAKIIRHPPFRYGEINIAIYDSWGLEPDKATQWQQIIEDEVHKNSQKEIRDWFHSIIYCIDAKRSRLDDFEIDIIRQFIDGGNKLIFVFTKADVAKETEIEALTKVLREQQWEFPVIPVCTLKRKLLSGKTTEPKGRNELLTAICRNFSENMLSIALKRYREDLDRSLNQAIQNILQKFDEEAGPLGFFTSYGDEFRTMLEKLINKEFQNAIDLSFSNFMSTLKQISEMEAIVRHNISIHIPPEWQNKINMENVQIDLEETSNWDNSSKSNFGEFIACLILLPFALCGLRKDMYKHDLIEYCQEQKQKILGKNKDTTVSLLATSSCTPGFTVTALFSYLGNNTASKFHNR